MIHEDCFDKQSKLLDRQSPKNWEHEKTGHSGKWSRITSNLFPGCRKAGQTWQFHSCSRCWWKSEKFCNNQVFFCRRHSTIEVRCWNFFSFSLAPDERFMQVVICKTDKNLILKLDLFVLCYGDDLMHSNVRENRLKLGSKVNCYI